MIFESAEQSSRSFLTRSGRYVPLVVWVVTVLTLVFIALKIVSYGLIPAGDAQRHVAHAFTDRTYREIMVLHPAYVMNHSPGWELLLRKLHEIGGLNRDDLISFSIAFGLLCVLFAPLRWLSRPEAWLAAVLAQLIAIPGFMWRLTQGRPYLFTEGMLITVLVAWSRDEPRRPGAVRLLFTVVAVALSVWVHGSWYLWALPLMAFYLSQRFRTAAWLTGCVGVGVLAGALLTGRPFTYLKQAIIQTILIGSEKLPPAQLVGEFRPSHGEILTMLLLGLIFLWWLLEKRPDRRALTSPLICQFVLCWVLGLYAARFFADWAVPAAMIWMAFRTEELMAGVWPAHSWNRLVACVLLASGLYLHSTANLNEIFTFNHNEVYLDAETPELRDWFPEPEGIFYTANFDFFYKTFYQNPTGAWRYAMGLEPGLMTEENRKTYRRIQTDTRVSAYDPWLNKMTAADRLVIFTEPRPPIPRLEWKRAASGIWIGRLPREPSHSATANDLPTSAPLQLQDNSTSAPAA